MKNIIRHFFGFLMKYKLQFWSCALMIFFVSIVENITPYFYKLLMDSITSNKLEKVFLFLVVFMLIKLSTNWFNVLTHYVQDKIYIPSSRDARVAVFKKIQDLDFAFHANKNTGSLISAFKRGDGAFGSMFDDGIEIVRIFLSLLVMLFFFVRISPVVMSIMLLVFLINISLSFFLIKFNMGKRKAFNSSEDEISGIITDNLINYETVKFFAKEEREKERLLTSFKKWTKNIWGYGNSFRVMDFSVGTVSNIGMFFIFYVVINKLIRKEITVGDFVMVASFITGYYYRFFELLYRFRNVAKHFVDIQNYFSILDMEVGVKDPQIPVTTEEIKGDISFENVSFNYSDSNRKVLNNFDLNIKAGESVAFVGRSGAGKTTIIKSLLRFYDVSEGRILIDGIDIKDFTKSNLRSFMGIVPQEPVLFNNTIGFNIAYGNDNASQEEIEEATKMANLSDFIESLPLKYETQVGERGVKLSGGQKQRLAIARMILSNPRIIIFDEATSNLDSESEKLIQDSLWKIAKGRTVLIVAHRFSTVRKAGRIVVLENGNIIESGSHKELIEDKNGLYYYLWSLQTKGVEEIGEDENFLES